jgi:hypothetical protein
LDENHRCANRGDVDAGAFSSELLNEAARKAGKKKLPRRT